MAENWRTVVRIALRDGGRDDHHVLLSEIAEFETYQRMITEAARALFLQDHPARQRVLRGFESTLQLGFRTVEEGSAVLPLEVRDVPAWIDTPIENYVDRAVAATTRVYRSAASGQRPAEALPATVLTLMEQFGASLPDDRILEVLPVSPDVGSVVVDERVRAAVGTLVPGRMEDEYQIEGTVTQADVLAKRFRVNVGRRGIEAPFSDQDKDRVIDALRDSDERRVVVRGRALLERGGVPVRFVSVAEITFADERASDLRAAWTSLLSLVEQRAMGGLPHDLASAADDYLYGPKDDRA